MNLRLLRNRSFMILWVGQMISVVGDYFTFLAIPIVINRLTGSAGMVGLSFISGAVPALFLGPLAGVFVDRWDRRKVMILSDVLRGGLVLCLLTIQDVSQVWVFYVVGFLVACASQFFFPARGAVLPLVVTDPEDWLPANGMMQIIQTAGMLAGPALAGFAIGLWGERVAFFANAAGFFCSALALLLMRVPHTVPGAAIHGAVSGAASAVGQVWADLREGLAFLFNSRVMVSVLICMTVANVGFSAVNVIWIPYLQRKFGIGAAGLGLADSALGIGMLLSGMALGYLATRMRKTLMVALGMLVIGLLYMLIDYLPGFGWILGFQFLSGLFVTPLNSALNTITQMAVPDLKRGRVGSSLTAFTTAGGLLSMAFVSLFGDAVGLRSVFIILGLFVLVSGLSGLWLLKEPEMPLPNTLDPKIDAA